MVQKYQSEIAPIFYYGISTKSNEKDLKIPILQTPDWKHPYWMSLYKQHSRNNKNIVGSSMVSIKLCICMKMQYNTMQCIFLITPPDINIV